jgi:diaminopimelate decarboxylase
MAVAAVELAKTFGTPLLAIDELRLRSEMQRFRKAFANPRWHCDIVYAAKALALKAIAKIAHEEGLGFDACSEGELQTALQAGIPASDCILHGCAKTERELQLALRSHVRFIVIDNYEEIVALRRLVEHANTRVPVLLRVNVGISAPTIAQIQTSTPESKFGFPIQDGQARAVAIDIARSPLLELCGVHCHIGSQIADLSVYAEVVRRLSNLVLTLECEDISCKLINAGGGLGVPDNDTDSKGLNPEEWAKTLFGALDKWFPGDEKKRSLMIEPGRAIVARAGTTLYRVAVRKMMANGEQALIVDGGMSDNPRPALYDAAYPVSIASRPNEPPDGKYSIFGRHCETDLLFRAVPLPNPQVGDVLLVHNTGAYTYSMASNYNRFTKPAVVLTDENSTRIIAQREPLEHVLDLDAI